MANPAEWSFFQSPTGQWHWRCNDGDGGITGSFVGFKKKSDCIKNAEQHGYSKTSKVQALIDFVYEKDNKRLTRAGFERVRRVCRMFGLSEEETTEIIRFYEYNESWFQKKSNDTLTRGAL